MRCHLTQANFVPFRLIKRRSFNLLCVLELLSQQKKMYVYYTFALHAQIIQQISPRIRLQWNESQALAQRFLFQMANGTLKIDPFFVIVVLLVKLYKQLHGHSSASNSHACPTQTEPFRLWKRPDLATRWRRCSRSC